MAYAIFQEASGSFIMVWERTFTGKLTTAVFGRLDRSIPVVRLSGSIEYITIDRAELVRYKQVLLNDLDGVAQQQIRDFLASDSMIKKEPEPHLSPIVRFYLFAESGGTFFVGSKDEVDGIGKSMTVQGPVVLGLRVYPDGTTREEGAIKDDLKQHPKVTFDQLPPAVASGITESLFNLSAADFERGGSPAPQKRTVTSIHAQKEPAETALAGHQSSEPTWKQRFQGFLQDTVQVFQQAAAPKVTKTSGVRDAMQRAFDQSDSRFSFRTFCLVDDQRCEVEFTVRRYVTPRQDGELSRYEITAKAQVNGRFVRAYIWRKRPSRLVDRDVMTCHLTVKRTKEDIVTEFSLNHAYQMYREVGVHVAN